MSIFDQIKRFTSNFRRKAESEGLLTQPPRKHRMREGRARPRGMWKSRFMVSGVNVPMRKVRRPRSANMEIDTRPRDDGHPNCEECGHNRYKTVYKFDNGQRKIACRHCGEEKLV